MVKVSVIVPVYNQEKYLEKCLDSILAQTLQEIEIILVDDGSTDSTPEILERYAQKEKRITVLRQQNLYAGTARNNGLQAAQGEYVIFWDSDDYFPEDALEALYLESKKYDADICVGEATKVDTQMGTVREKCFIKWDRVPEKRPFNVSDMPRYIFNFGKNYVWNKLYKKSFLEEKELRFSKQRRANDVYFVFKAFVLAERIAVTDHVIVQYQFKHADSLSRNELQTKEDVLNALTEVKNFLTEAGYWENKEIRQSFINNAFALLRSLLSMIEDRGAYRTLFDYYKEKSLPELGIGEAEIEWMHSEKSAWELSNILSCDAETYIFKQYRYYQEKTIQYKESVSRAKEKLAQSSANNIRQKEKIEELKQDKARKLEVLQIQREKMGNQKEKIENQRARIEDLKQDRSRKAEIIRDQREKIKSQKEKIQEQNGLLDQTLVKAALKVQKKFH